MSQLLSRRFIELKGGTFLMGSDNHYSEEAPSHEVTVGSFCIDATPVTNADFAVFVEQTGYQTTAEVAPSAGDYPLATPDQLVPASLVFTPPPRAVNLTDWNAWWQLVEGANWQHPWGPDSSIDALADHPVVHVSYFDASAYADWAKRSLPSEAQWEFAARGGLDGAEYAWGDQLKPGGQLMANIWEGEFPHRHANRAGHPFTSAVGFYPQNAFGLFDMIGNVWEWTASIFANDHSMPHQRSCCVPRSQSENTRSEGTPTPTIPVKVLKGGSHLCADAYCQRYRPSARQPQEVYTSSSHIGFRCIS